jgi:hypothetical protein
MPRYTISRILGPDAPDRDNGGTTVVAAAHGETPRDCLQRCVNGEGVCDPEVNAMDPEDETAEVFADLFDPADWYFVNNDDKMHDFDLFKLTRPEPMATMQVERVR